MSEGQEQKAELARRQSGGVEDLKSKVVGSNPGSGLEGDSENKRQLFWTRDGFDGSNDICKESLLKLELPLINSENKMLGILWLIKDLRRDTISHYTLRRVEHLRRTVIETLGKIKADELMRELRD